MAPTISELINERMTTIMGEVDAINSLLTGPNQPQAAPGRLQLTYNFRGKDGSVLDCVAPLTDDSSTAAFSLISQWTTPPPADSDEVTILDAIEISTNLNQINKLFSMLIGLGQQKYERYINQLNDKAYFLGFVPDTARHCYVDPNNPPQADQPATDQSATDQPVHFPAKPVSKTDALSEGFVGNDGKPIDVSTIITGLTKVTGLNRTLNYLRKVRKEEDERERRGEPRRVNDRNIAVYLTSLSTKGLELGYVVAHEEPKLFIPRKKPQA